MDASFGEEEQWTAENTEENAVAMEIENAATMEIQNAEEIEANAVLPVPWYVCLTFFICTCSLFYIWLIILFLSSRISRGRGKKRPREEEIQEPSVSYLSYYENL